MRILKLEDTVTLPKLEEDRRSLSSTPLPLHHHTALLWQQEKPVQQHLAHRRGECLYDRRNVTMTIAPDILSDWEISQETAQWHLVLLLLPGHRQVSPPRSQLQAHAGTFTVIHNLDPPVPSPDACRSLALHICYIRPACVYASLNCHSTGNYFSDWVGLCLFFGEKNY